MPKTIISPARALLILIDKYRDDAVHVAQLKELYLCGVRGRSAEEYEQRLKVMKQVLDDPSLSAYEISYDPKTISEDPSRRYFETHLAYESLNIGIKNLDKRDLAAQLNALKQGLHHSILAIFEDNLNGESDDSDDTLNKDYADYIAKIKLAKGQPGALFPELPEEEREKIILLVQCTFLSILNSKLNRDVPLNIYGKGVFSDEYRGKVIIEDQETTRSQHFGLMKGHTPLSRSDIAHSEGSFAYLKPSDQSTFDEQAPWVGELFGQMMHPFSNSISGTMLCQLRCHAYLQERGQNAFTSSAEKFSQYIQLVIATRLFKSGGHSLYEFIAPLAIRDVIEKFKTIPGFEEIDLKSMFLTHNQEGFDKALEDTINYHKALERRAAMHGQIRDQPPVLNPIKEQLAALKEAAKSEHEEQQASTDTPAL